MPADLDASLRSVWRTARRMDWTRGAMRLTLSWTVPEADRPGLPRELGAGWLPASPEDYQPAPDPGVFMVQRVLVRPGQEELRTQAAGAHAAALRRGAALIGVGVGRA